MENEQSMLEKLLKKVGEYAEVKSTRGGRISGDCIAQTQEKTRELSLFDAKYRPSDGLIDEILLTYSTGYLMGEGVPVLDAFNAVADNFTVLNHNEPAEAIKYVHDSVRQGDTMAAPMSKLRFFSPESAYLTAIGEWTGDVDKTLKRAADILQIKAEQELTPEQTGQIVSLYGTRMLIGAVASNGDKIIETLSGLSKEHSIGPDPKVFKVLELFEARDSAEYGYILGK